MNQCSCSLHSIDSDPKAHAGRFPEHEAAMKVLRDPSSLSSICYADSQSQRRKEEKHKDMVAAIREKARNDPVFRATYTKKAKEYNISLQEYVDMLCEPPVDEDTMDIAMSAPDNAVLERLMFKLLKVMVPPADAGEPPELEKVFKEIRADNQQGLPNPKAIHAIHKQISQRWIPNYTLLDRDW